MKILLILLLQLIYVPILTLRTIFLVKNMTRIAAGLGFLESLVYVFGLALVFSGDQSPLAMIVYAAGFGLGILLGGAIENKLAIGYNNLYINLPNKNQTLIEKLREEGFGVTVYEGEGRDSIRTKLDILTKRNKEDELMDFVLSSEPQAFIVSFEPQRFKGGYLLKSMKKTQKKKKLRGRNL